MLNREYHKRAAAQGETPFQIPEAKVPEAIHRLPWAGIFEPWRPFVLIAAAAEEKRRPASGSRRPKAGSPRHSRQRLLFDGKLRGVQLSLFPDNDAENFTVPENSSFPPLAAMIQEVLPEDELAASAEFEKLKALTRF